MMLHRVRAEGSDDSSPNRGLAISPAFLERFVRAAQHNGYTFVSLDHFIEQLLVGSENKLLVLTFDDGYLDNFTEAYPLLKRMGIRLFHLKPKILYMIHMKIKQYPI